MRQPIPATWIVVVDSTRASFYTLHHDANGHRRIDEISRPLISGLHAHAHDLGGDRPGRSKSAAGSVQHYAYEPPHDAHKLEKHNFVEAVVHELKAAYDAHRFVRLAIIAPERTIGEIRAVAPDTLRKAIWREIGKDLTKLSPKELWLRIGSELIDHPAAPA